MTPRRTDAMRPRPSGKHDEWPHDDQLRRVGATEEGNALHDGKTLLVTGISGFIAKHCAIDSIKHGYRVRGTVRGQAKAAEVKATIGQHCDAAKLTFVEADLLKDDGWGQAMRGIDGVLHVASPFTLNEPKDPDELIRPAVEGTLRVLKAAIAAGVPRFVQTSSTVAIQFGHLASRAEPFTEADWTNLEGPGVTIYARSKTLAERAARDLVAAEKPALYFATVNPGFVQGPLLDRDMGGSGESVRMFMQGKYPGCPKISLPVVDVRDIAKMHRFAFETDAPSGGRYLGVSEVASFLQMMLPIKAQLGAKAKKVPGRELPDFLVRLVGLFDPTVRTILPDLGRVLRYDNTLTRRALKMDFIGVAKSAPAMAQSLVDLGLV